MAKLTTSYQYIGRSNAVSCPNGYNYYILLYAKTVANATTGKHTVSVRQYLACSNDSSFNNWNTTGYVKVAGTNAIAWTKAKVPADSWGNSASLTVGGYTYRRHVLLKEGSVTISNCFGDDKEVAISTSWVMNDSYSAGWFPYTGKYATANITVTLAGIAGASSPTLSATSAKMGDSLTITTNRLSSAFTHTLKYTFGGETGTIATGVGASHTWTIPDLAHLCNNALSGSCEISCTTYNGSTAIGTKTVSITFSVPSPTVPTVSSDKLNMNDELTVTVAGKSSNFTHDILYSFAGKKTGTMATGIKDSTSKVFSLAEFASIIPDQTSGTLVITCATYNGTAKVGEASADVTLMVPLSSETRPALSMALLPSPNDAVSTSYKGLVSFEGMYIQGISKVAATFTASSDVSTIASYELIVGNKGKNGTSPNIESDIVDTSGEITVTGKVTDARGYTTEVSQQITVHAYTNPKVIPYTGKNNAVCVRCLSDGTPNDAGTYLLIQAGKGYSSVGGINVCRMSYRHKLSTTSSYGAHSTLLDWNNASAMFSGAVSNGSFASTQSYDVELSVEDALGGNNTIVFSIPTDEVDFHLNNGKGAFGKYAEKEGTLEVDWNLEANKGITVGGDFRIDPQSKTITGGYSFDGTFDTKAIQQIMLMMNPVGTIKLTTTDINPSEYIGGTWERWGQGRVPVGVGQPEQNNRDMFGTLTEEELGINFTTVEGKGGKYRHQLTASELPKLEGNITFHYSDTSTNVASVDGVFSATKTGAKYRNGGTEGGGATSVGAIKMSVGGGNSHNNMPPYVTCYMWKRTA